MGESVGGWMIERVSGWVGESVNELALHIVTFAHLSLSSKCFGNLWFKGAAHQPWIASWKLRK